ncbi:hypothetical protein EV182_001167, partial [Spiromyces aspiralis]
MLRRPSRLQVRVSPSTPYLSALHHDLTSPAAISPTPVPDGLGLGLGIGNSPLLRRICSSPKLFVTADIGPKSSFQTKRRVMLASP